MKLMEVGEYGILKEEDSIVCMRICGGDRYLAHVCLIGDEYDG